MGFVHGDIRMVNVIFSTDNDEVWLIDFDLLGLLTRSTQVTTFPGYLKGTREHCLGKNGPKNP